MILAWASPFNVSNGWQPLTFRPEMFSKLFLKLYSQPNIGAYTPILYIKAFQNNTFESVIDFCRLFWFGLTWFGVSDLFVCLSVCLFVCLFGAIICHTSFHTIMCINKYMKHIIILTSLVQFKQLYSSLTISDNPWPGSSLFLSLNCLIAETFCDIFHSFEAGIANAIANFKQMIKYTTTF